MSYSGAMALANYHYYLWRYYKAAAKKYIKIAKAYKKTGNQLMFKKWMGFYHEALADATRNYKLAIGYKPNGRCKFDR